MLLFLVVSLLLLTNLSLKQISDNIYGTIRPKLERQAEKDKNRLPERQSLLMNLQGNRRMNCKPWMKLSGRKGRRFIEKRR